MISGKILGYAISYVQAGSRASAEMLPQCPALMSSVGKGSMTIRHLELGDIGNTQESKEEQEGKWQVAKAT